MRAFLLDSGNAVPLEDLRSLDVLYWQLEPAQHMEQLDRIAAERGYSSRDEVRLDAATPDLDSKLALFFQEHYHEDEEIRFIKSGHGFFDVRDKQDRWVRLEVEAMDLVILPEGIFHRFGLGERRCIHAVRLFTSAPKWTPIMRTTGQL